MNTRHIPGQDKMIVFRMTMIAMAVVLALFGAALVVVFPPAIVVAILLWHSGIYLIGAAVTMKDQPGPKFIARLAWRLAIVLTIVGLMIQTGQKRENKKGSQEAER